MADTKNAPAPASAPQTSATPRVAKSMADVLSDVDRALGRAIKLSAGTVGDVERTKKLRSLGLDVAQMKIEAQRDELNV